MPIKDNGHPNFRSGPVKILHVFDHSLPNYDGYAFRSREIIRFQRQLGIETVQVTSSKHSGLYVPSETVDGLEFHRTPVLGGIYGLPVMDQVGVVVGLQRRLAHLVTAYRPDVIHAHSPSLNGIAALAASRAAGVPVVYEVRSFWEDAAVDTGVCREGDLRYRLTRASETRVVRRADHVVPICRGIANDLAARGVPESRMTVVSNSVDFARFSASLDYDAERAAGLQLTRGKTLGFAGSFFAFEGLETLIDAVAVLHAQDPAVRLLLVGDGLERANLEARARGRGVTEFVIFTGRVPHGEIESWYGLMDILVYPRVPMRLTELVTPLKPLEAMAYGKAVIASDVGGHRELIEDGRTGLLFRAGDVSSLATTTAGLLDDPSLRARLCEAARAHVGSRHNWAATIEHYPQIYAAITSGRRAGS